jgi:hypothetical protein
LILTKRKRKIKSRSEKLKEDFPSSAIFKHTNGREKGGGGGWGIFQRSQTSHNMNIANFCISNGKLSC